VCRRPSPVARTASSPSSGKFKYRGFIPGHVHVLDDGGDLPGRLPAHPS
jgi:hypothetical protein